jgi:hypothetical protein
MGPGARLMLARRQGASRQARGGTVAWAVGSRNPRGKPDGPHPTRTRCERIGIELTPGPPPASGWWADSERGEGVRPENLAPGARGRAGLRLRVGPANSAEGRRVFCRVPGSCAMGRLDGGRALTRRLAAYPSRAARLLDRRSCGRRSRPSNAAPQALPPPGDPPATHWPTVALLHPLLP